MMRSSSPRNYNGLDDIAVVSGSDAWAVGSSAAGGDRVPAPDGGYMYSHGPDMPLIEHWNGTRWSVVATPAMKGALGAVSTSGPRDAWAVGRESDLLLHWNGEAWRSVPPDRSAGAPVFTDVVALSALDAWAVGYTTENYLRTLTEHWDGHRWKVVPSPGAEAKKDFRLDAVAAVGPADVWGVGVQYFRHYTHTLTEHWNGRRWRIVPSPNAPTTVPSVTGELDYNYLQAAAAIGPTDVWAVGFHDRAGAGRLIPLAEHWDGRRWSIVPTPSLAPGGMNGVAASPSGDVWAVGSQQIGGTTLPLVIRWHGDRWESVQGCRVGATAALASVAAFRQESWAVGTASNAEGSRSQTFMERLSDATVGEGAAGNTAA